MTDVIYTQTFINRFDLMAKLLYIKFRYIEWYKQLYINHIQTFNGGWEYPGTKVNVDQFVDDFNTLIESFKSKGFVPEYKISLGCNNVIHNGAHRLSLSYINNITPLFNIDSSAGETRYNYSFFRNRNPTQTLGRPLILSGMEHKYMDRMALEFCFHIKNFKIICIFPRAEKHDDKVEHVLRENGYIYYKKRIKLSNKELINLTYELYRGEDWIGGYFPNNPDKGNLCYGGDDLRIYIFIPNNKCNVASMKKSVRDIYKIQKHSVHIHDTYEEGIRIAKTLLNKNSLEFLKNSNVKLSINNTKLLILFQKNIKPDMENYCIDSSFVMALYGMREAADLDYLTLEDVTFPVNKDITNHNSWSHHYTEPKDDIILNPDFHFYWAGIKFATLDIVRKMKEKRNETKDKIDIKIINQY